MGGVGLGDDEQAGRVLVEPMDDAGPLHAADPREARAAMADQRIDQRAVGMARRRVDDEARRLVDHDRGARPRRRCRAGCPRRSAAIPPAPAPRRRCRAPSASLRRGRARRSPSTRTSPASISALSRVRDRARCRSAAAAEKAIEPLARARGVDVERCGPFGRDERARAASGVLRLRSSQAPRCSRPLLGLGVHARSRRRGSPPRGRLRRRRARRAVRAPQRSIPSSGGRRAVRVEAAPHRRDMAGRVAAAAADDPRAAIDREAGVEFHQFRRAGIVDLGAVPVRHAGIGLGDQRRVRVGLAHRQDRDQQVGGADAAIGAEGERLRRRSRPRSRRALRAPRPSSCVPAVSKLAVTV